MKKIDILLALYIACIVVSELMGSKSFTIWGISASVAIFTFPLTFTINDVVTEVFGKKRAISFVRSGIIVLLFLMIFASIAILLPPSERFKSNNEAYAVIFGKSLRIIIASLAAFWLSERFDVMVYSKIRKKLSGATLWLRINLSNFASQFIDTSIFMLLAFYEPGHFAFVFSLILPYWALKCFFSVVETPFAYYGIKWLKKSEESI